MPWTIWIDADACPVVIKEIVFRASLKRQLNLILVANQYMAVPKSVFIKLIVVPSGLDVADQYIIEHVKLQELVITADIPLAAEVVKKGAIAINPRGETYTDVNIGRSLSIRNFMQDMREAGLVQSRTAVFNKQDQHRFASSLDRLITRYHKLKSL